jgi:DNA-binding winged helix-turn-helix (wHTH) protein
MVRFGNFEFDAATRRLQRGGVNVHLAPKAYDLLALLIAAAPGVVAKRELHARLWPGGMVTDATLVALIKQLRRALGDQDRDTPLIRTVHRVGYALELVASRRERVAAATPERWLQIGQRRLMVAAGENIVGRDPLAQIRLNDAVVSRRHARIAVQGTTTLLEDLGSKNGTFIDGQRLVGLPMLLRDGSQMAFGTVRATYRESGDGMPTMTHSHMIHEP